MLTILVYALGFAPLLELYSILSSLLVVRLKGHKAHQRIRSKQGLVGRYTYGPIFVASQDHIRTLYNPLFIPC